jgi:TrmH family RNA methyltransferase
MLSKTIVKYIQRLAHKKFRDEHGVFIAEGPKVVEELLRSGDMKCKNIYGTSEWFDEIAQSGLLPRISFDLGANLMGIGEIDLETISQLQTPNKVVGIFYKKEQNLTDLQDNLSIMLDDIQDPGNLGTIIRIADWFGVKNIICSNNCVDCYNPKVVQASMGSLARVNILYTELEKFIKDNAAIKTYAATLAGKSISSMGQIKEGIILIGNESKGVSERLLDMAAEQITIPKQGEAESLNAAVACGIILSHLVHGNTL